MRRSAGLATVAIALTSFLALAPPAAAGVHRFYEGQTSQNREISLELVNTTRKGLFLVTVSFDIRLRCEDGSRQSFSVGFGGFREPLTDGVLVWDLVGGSDAVHLHGTFGPRRGSGTLEYTEAVLTPDETAQICTTGELSWTVTRVSPSASTLGSSHPPITATMIVRRAHGLLVERSTSVS
jgi:hypothetical protein